MDVNNKISNTSNINDIPNSNVKRSNINTKLNVENKENEKENKKSLVDKKDVSKDTLDKLIKEANNKFKLVNKEFSYDIHEETNRVTVKIKDSETGDIIKEIPSEESLDLAAKIKEMVGLLIDEKS